MKRALLLCCIVMVSFAHHYNAFGQMPIRLGFVGGLNIANQSYSVSPFGLALDAKASRIAVIVGGVVELGISNLWYLQLEPRYVQKGSKYGDFAITGAGGPTVLGTSSLIIKLDYIEIPILLKAKFGDGDFRPFVLAGPSTGFNIAANLDVPGSGVSSQSQVTTNDIKDQTELIDVAIDLGVGAEYQFGSTIALLANVRYSFGLTNIAKNQLASTGTMRSTGLQLLVGALFNL